MNRSLIRSLARAPGRGLRRRKPNRDAMRKAVSRSVRFLPSGRFPFGSCSRWDWARRTFPEREKHDLLDLRLARRRAGDVSASQRDRYLFLETILAARERTFFSWISRDALTGQTLEPSPVIRELKLILRGYLGAAELSRLTTIHPASSYHLDYFPDLRGATAASGLVSFDRHAHHGARMAALRADLATACGAMALPAEGLLESLAPQVRSGLAPALRIIEMPSSSTGAESAAADPDEIPLSLGALRRYLECPLQGAARYALGMIDDEDEDDQDLENEPLTQSKLDLVVLLRDAFWAGRGDESRRAGEFRAGLAAASAPGQGAGGTVCRRRQKGVLTQARSMHRASPGPEDCRSRRMGTYSNRWRAGNRRRRRDPAADFAGRARCGVARATRCCASACAEPSRVSPRRDASIRCIARDSGAKPGDFLEGFLGAIAAGRRRPDQCQFV